MCDKLVLHGLRLKIPVKFNVGGQDISFDFCTINLFTGFNEMMSIITI